MARSLSLNAHNLRSSSDSSRKTARGKQRGKRRASGGREHSREREAGRSRLKVCTEIRGIAARTVSYT